MSSNKEWKIISSKVGYDHPFFKVREDHVLLPNGHEINDFTVWENGNVAQVLAITAQKEVILARQYKQGARKMIVECPGGFIEKGEDPLIAAKRELQEEVGYESDNFQLLGNFHHHPTKETSVAYFYLALDAVQSQNGTNQEITEDIEVIKIPMLEAIKWIESGKIIQTGTIAGIMLAFHQLEENFFHE